MLIGGDVRNGMNPMEWNFENPRFDIYDRVTSYPN